LYLGTLLSVILVLTTIGIHFEFLRHMPELSEKLGVKPRLRILFVMVGAFAAHTLEIYLFALGYRLLDAIYPPQLFDGVFDGRFSDYVYFSAASYTSLGVGDIWPLGPVRIISGSEALTGLIMIAWTASFTYLMMGRYWRRD
jgi:Ion channel